MSVALLPQFTSEMDDSVMLEDHPADTAIAIDMESPKQNGNGAVSISMAFASDPAAPQGFWPQSQTNPPNDVNTDQIVDAEFDIELTNYEEDGMMTATEVEMSVPTYGDTYEYEMAYDTGHIDPVYDAVDADVHDAEVLDAAVGHAAPVPDSTTSAVYTTNAHPPQPPQPAEYETHIVDPPTEVAPIVHSYPTDAESTAHPLDDTASMHSAVVPPVTSEAANEATQDNEARYGEAHPTSEPLNSDPKDVASAVEDVPSTVIVNTSDVALEIVESGEGVKPLGEPQDPVPTSTEDKAEVNSVEAVAVVTATYEVTDAEPEDPLAAAITPVLLSMPSESERPQRMFSLFKAPNPANIPSSSKSTSDLPTLLLENHHYLFVEPIANLLVQLRTELLQAQPEAIPPADFEYKELCIAARELQLILTEVRSPT
jgi:hypothetical protein